MAALLPIGTLVIADDTDAPRPRNVAVVVDHGETYHRLRYVSMKLAGFGTFSATRPTPVQEFGVTLVVDAEGRLMTATTGAGVATYPDQKPRRWQDHGGERITLSIWARRAWATFKEGVPA